MTAEQLKTQISDTLKSFTSGNLTSNALNLFQTLGYITERQAPLNQPTFAEFQDTYIGEKRFDETKAKVSDWKYVDLLFQLSKEEILKQHSLFDTKQVNRTIIETYLFFAIELAPNEYTRTDLAVITREVNRLFPMPAMILFKYGSTLTLSVINRRLHKKDESKDVLEKVTLIKDINIERPHRAHIEILYDLSFDELKSKYYFTNFVELHNAWQKTLDTKELNKRFYSELFNWYLWAVQSVKFPNDVDNEKDNTVYNSESVIRLLTRLIFVWFIKEKGLIPDILFDEKQLKNVLIEFNPSSFDTSKYYRAILQNLFFATLNTEMDNDVTKPEEKRRFINLLPQYNNPDYTDQTKYRYKDYFTNPDEAIKLFSPIPFLNGGLFECLDSKEDGKEFRYDGFSSIASKQAFVPDKLFFADEYSLDLNSEYGTKGNKYKVEGIIRILDSYKFTITENTPLEEEIALDPELLGKVFENLLASYNPETQTTARKQTGSFYTPREIVNYMVDESLIAYFMQKLDNTEETEIRLHNLFAHTEDLHEFTDTETDLLIDAISQAKILDPACGSGAFPMGVLHRLVDLLNKLDPDNEKWNDLQIKRAIAETAEVFTSGSLNEEREIRLNEINKAFDLRMNYPDYARKLFLIENCIYGVDIQQIAIQISKLRFFISLIVDQKVNDRSPNRNILSMPNLETKFVAANTLIGLDKPKNEGDHYSMMAIDVERLEKELASIRHKVFFTRKYSEKKILKNTEKTKREELQIALTNTGYTINTATQMACWNPFDPMQSAKFFDPETMFGFRNGFDIIIGNPPYVSLQRMEDTASLKKANFETFENTGDLYSLFYEQGINLLSDNGILCYITSNKWINANYGKSIRKFLATKTNPLILIDFAKVKIFEAATVFVNILITQKATNQNLLQACSITGDKIPDIALDAYFGNHKFKLTNLGESIWKVSNAQSNDINIHIENQGIALFHWKDIRFYRGITSGLNEAFHISKAVRDEIVKSSEKSEKFIKPLIRGKDIKRWSYKHEDLYLLFIPWHFPLHNDQGITNASSEAEKMFMTEYQEIYQHLNNFKNELSNRNQAETGVRYEWYALQRYGADFWPEFENKKIVWIEISDRANYAYDESGAYLTNSAYFMTGKHLKYLLAVLNSKVSDYYFSQITATIAGGRKRYTGQYVEQVPVPQISEKEEEPFNKLVDYILYLKPNDGNQEARQAGNYFENILETMVYELYFEDAVKKSGYEVIKHVQKLPNLKNDSQALVQLIDIYHETFDKNHPIRNSTFYITTIPIIKEIENSFIKNK
jgi:adenine-specific DNA-methyltransferase